MITSQETREPDMSKATSQSDNRAAHLMISARKSIADGVGLRALTALDEAANKLQHALAEIGEASLRVAA